MRRTIRIALVLSVLAVLGSLLVVFEADYDIDEAFGGGSGDDDGWALPGIGALVALVPLAFVWLAVFVVFVVRKGLRVLGADRR